MLRCLFANAISSYLSSFFTTTGTPLSRQVSIIPFQLYLFL